MSTLGVPTPFLGPQARQAMSRCPYRPQGKRGKLLIVLAAFADASYDSPPISALARHTKLPRGAVCHLVNRMELDGAITIARGDRTLRERNTYALNVEAWALIREEAPPR